MVLYIAPERLETGILSLIEANNEIGMIVVDECHCAVIYHSRNKRQEAAMLSGERHIIVAASALSMGVDVRNVDLVIHYNMPMSLADYCQMAGRAGRDGQGARSILLYNPDDYYTNRALLRDIEDEAVKNL